MMVRDPLGWQLEQTFWQRGIRPVVGMDEAGRGAWAGLVSVAVVLLPEGEYAFQDSKTLSATRRSQFAHEIKQVAHAWAVAFASREEIDERNILKATHLAAHRAINWVNMQLGGNLAGIVSDYMHFRHPNVPVLSRPRADATSPQVAAAGILAKVARDEVMCNLALHYPNYGFEKHKGYGTKAHQVALGKYGVCPEHRRSFRPIRERLLIAASL